jgi:7-cyano-7-deazaguanine synthase in queuosine biosynthesis
VFAADSSIRRGGIAGTGFGAGWHRHLHFRIPVRQLARWQQGSVTDALTELVRFLLDDEVSFEFFDCDPEVARRRYLDLFDAEQSATKIEDIVMLSGGLDSLGEALETLTSGPGRVALVTHVSAQKILPHQLAIASDLKRRFPGRVLHFPIRARRDGTVAAESTQRSRSFLFIALGYVVAKMLGAKRINFFENGVISLNLPISRQVVGSTATRTTHPLTLALMRDFLAALGDREIEIHNRFAWITKSEVLERIVAAGGSDLIRVAVSCTNVRSRDTLRTHCGECSQCLDRRFAVLATDLEAHEPIEMYETEVLIGGRLKPISRTMVMEWTRHALEMSSVDPEALAIGHAGEIQRILRGHPELSRDETLERYAAMLRRHGEQALAVLGSSIRMQASAIAARTLDPDSLLAMFVNGQTGAAPDIDRMLSPPLEL